MLCVVDANRGFPGNITSTYSIDIFGTPNLFSK